MCACFNNLAVIKYNYLISVSNSGKSMRDFNNSFALCKRGKCFFNQNLVFRIGKGGRLVEYNNRRVL